jgi:RNA polymerase sigma-70 factor (ECF subfamily)
MGAGIEEQTAASATDHHVLINRVKAGDQEAFQTLLAPLQPTAFCIARSITGSRQDAEDALMEGMMNVYSALVRGKFREGMALEPWVCAIVRNAARRVVRSGRRRKSKEMGFDDAVAQIDAGPASRPDEAAIRVELEDILRDAVNALPEKRRVAVECVYFRGLSYEQAAQELGCPVGTIKSRLNRAMEKLKSIPALAALRDAQDAGEDPRKGGEADGRA